MTTPDPIMRAALEVVREHHGLIGAPRNPTAEAVEAVELVTAVRPLIEAEAYRHAARAIRSNGGGQPDIANHYAEKLERWADNTEKGAKP